MIEFLVTMQVHIPDSVDEPARAELLRREGERAAELARTGTLLRLWRIPGRRANYGLWSATDPTALHDAISSLPMFPYLEIEVVALARHPNDPAGASE